jgi:hypothetical protein
MLRGISISMEDVSKLLEHVFAISAVDVYTSDSEYGRRTERFDSARDCQTYLQARIEHGSKLVAFAVHYPEAGGYVQDRRVSLNPEKCDGHSFRYSVGGWGVIHIQLHVGAVNEIRCHVTVNSEKRARAWFGTYPELRDPDLWNWKLVEKRARRLQRRLKAFAQQTNPADRAKARDG